MFEVFRQRVERKSEIIVRRVRVDRSPSPQQVLDSLEDYEQAKCGKDDVATMPRGEGEEVDVVFFSAHRQLDDDELEREYERQGIVPDPYAQAQVNADDHGFVVSHSNATHWLGPDGKWRCLLTSTTIPSRFNWVTVKKSEDDKSSKYGDFWWYGGVRKVNPGQVHLGQ
ncbi:MAG: hypothetical protein V1846_04130 [Candidatus Komeilibacteria bacterium]